MAESGERTALITSTVNSNNNSSNPTPSRVYGYEDCGVINNLLLLRVWHAVLSGLTYGVNSIYSIHYKNTIFKQLFLSFVPFSHMHYVISSFL